MFTKTEIGIVKAMRSRSIAINQNAKVLDGFAEATNLDLFVSWPVNENIQDGIYNLSTGIPIKTDYLIEEWPKMPEYKSLRMYKKWTRHEAETLIKHICTDQSRPTLNGVNTAKIATDSHVLLSYSMDVMPSKITIPAEALKLAIKTKEKIFTIDSNENHSRINSGVYTIITRNLDGQYVHTERIIPEKIDRPNKIIFDISKLKPFLKKDFNILFSKENTRVYLKDDYTTLVAELPAMADGETIAFSGELLKRSFQSLKNEITFYYRGKLESAYCREENFIRIIMPLRQD